MTHVIKHKCGGIIEHIDKNRYRCKKCKKVDHKDKVVMSEDYNIVEV